MAQSKLPDKGLPVLGTILVISSGGLEHNGGIGRQMGYFLQACEGRVKEVAYRVVDSRGPWFLGSSPIRIGWAGLYLANAIMKLLWARFSSNRCLVHVNIAGRGSTIRKVILVTCAQAFGLRYLLHVHDYDYAHEYRRRGRLLQRLIARIFHGAERVVVLGGRDRKLLSSVLELPPDRVTVLHNAVPDPLPNVRRVRLAGAPCHLLFLGDLGPRKGVPELVQALASPAMKSRHWRATLAGGGAVDEFRQLARSQGILDRVHFPGWVDTVAVRALGADADVLVLPSHAEGLAMAVLEGLAHGLAVITTPVGAHPEVIESDVSGIFVPPGDVPALTDALVQVIDNEALRKRLGEGARRRYLEKFDVRGYADRLNRLHVDLLLQAHGATVSNRAARHGVSKLQRTNRHGRIAE